MAMSAHKQDNFSLSLIFQTFEMVKMSVYRGFNIKPKERQLKMTIKEKLKDLQEMKIYLTKDIEAKKHVILNKIYSLDDRDKNSYHVIKIQ